MKKIYTPKYRWQDKYANWRKEILERDNYNCKMCEVKKRFGLEVHHILPYLYFPKQRYDLKNGITLCSKCHRKIPRIMSRIIHKINIGSIFKQLKDEKEKTT